MNESADGYLRMRLGTSEYRNTGVGELSLIASVNESIRHAIDASAKISLIAVNANLVAGRAASGAAGFCIVAQELRRFSERMAATMQNWSALVYDLVQDTAHNRNQASRLYKLQATARCTPKALTAIAAACARSDNALRVVTTRNSIRVLELQDLIRRAGKQQMTGVVIARSAMIESAYGGSMRPILQEIAVNIEASIKSFSEHSGKVGQLMQKAAA